MMQMQFINTETDFIVCEVCGQKVARFEYDRHLRTHKEKRVEVCNICFKSFTNISNFKYHMSHHGENRPWLCNECPKNYKTKIDLLQHQRVHEKSRDPFQCDHCPLMFKTRSNYTTHLRTHIIRGPQHCDLCDGKLFVNLKSHIQMVHQKIRSHKCLICDKTFGKKSGLDRHIQTVHERLKCFSCDLCEKSFGEKAQLLRHRKVHFRPAFKEPDISEITEDQVVIEKEKRCMRCGICKKLLNSKAALKRHKLLVHDKKKNLLCDFCPRFFGEKSNLMRHILKSHTREANIKNEPQEEFDLEEMTEKIDAVMYECSACGKVLTTKWGWQGHDEVCRLKLQEKVNRQYENEEEAELEQVFLVAVEESHESIDIKEEPPFVDNQELEESLVQVSEAAEPLSIEVLIKEEPDFLENEGYLVDETNFEEHLEEDESRIEMLESKDINQDWAIETCEVEENIFEGDDSIEEPTVTFLKRFKCKLCPSTFKEKRYYQSHFRTVHGRKKGLTCNVSGCDENFVYRAQRLRHLRQKHPEFYEESDEEENFQVETVECELCDSMFADQEGLEEHTRKEHDCNEDERTCELCDPHKIFKKTRYLLLHIQAVHSDQVFSCDQCAKTFSFHRSLVRHIKGVHQNIRDFDCQEAGCEKSFRNSYELRQHVIGDHNKGDKSDRTCKICLKVFKKVKYMEIHCASIHNSEPQYNCPICMRSFSFQRSMERHVRAIHEDRRDFKCTSDGCEKAFRSRYDLNEHFNNIHALVKKKRTLENVICDICEKVCSTRKVLYSHKKLVHEGVKWGLKFECKLCKENFESKYKKSKHWGQVHRNGEIKFRICHLCKSQFQFFQDFKKHVEESHVGYFVCLTCGYYFSDESSLFIHQESHRKIEEELRQYICDVCSHRLTTKAQLLIHMRKHFSGDHYMCDVCGKSYKFIAPFLHHKKGHENRFDFPCSYCEKKFRVARDRMLHERTHTGERPYKCDQCQKSFAHKANYLSHLKTHEQRAFDCKNCGLHHISAAKLRIHEDLEHPEERPFKCNNCRKSFKVPHSFEHHKQKCLSDSKQTKLY